MARITVELVEFKGAWVARRVDEPSGDVLFVRKSSLRDKSQFSALQVGSRVSLAIKRVSGRGAGQPRWASTVPPCEAANGPSPRSGRRRVRPAVMQAAIGYWARPTTPRSHLTSPGFWTPT